MNFRRMFDYKERLREKLVMEKYYKTISEHPTMCQSDALVYAAETVREKLAGIKTAREEEEEKVNETLRTNSKSP